ncbi:MAG: PDR/VanB family oxidoreductase [Rhizobiaceae bacterium]|nr:PDR/VanB family oxidoreductase [Rhizobiaceae bacterium]
MAGPQEQIEVIVRHIAVETQDIRSFVLERADRNLLPAFRPGAHIDVEPVPGLIRQYSLVGSPADRTQYMIGVKKEPRSRGGSSAMHGALQEGSLLKISPPKNNFALDDTCGRCLLLAGGIGVTPLLSMAQSLALRGEKFELHYFVRTSADLAFSMLLSAPQMKPHVFFHFGLVPPALNDFLQILLREAACDDQIYMCGPTAFMESIRVAAADEDWSQDRIFHEHFSAAPSPLPLEGDSFVLRLLASDLELVVPPDRSIVEVMRDAGIEIATNCEQGICGTCVARMVEGDPDHRDMYLTDEEHDNEQLFAPCVSRAKSRLLVLDL